MLLLGLVLSQASLAADEVCSGEAPLPADTRITSNHFSILGAKELICTLGQDGHISFTALQSAASFTLSASDPKQWPGYGKEWTQPRQGFASSEDDCKDVTTHGIQWWSCRPKPKPGETEEPPNFEYWVIKGGQLFHVSYNFPTWDASFEPIFKRMFESIELR